MQPVTARLHSATSMEIEVLVLLPVFLGKCVSRLRADDIPPEFDVTWLMDAIIMGIEKRIPKRNAYPRKELSGTKFGNGNSSESRNSGEDGGNHHN